MRNPDGMLFELGPGQSGFSITDGKGFQLTFENGWTVSVQFGPGNYATHYGDSCMDWITAPKKRPEHYESITAEIAAFNASVWWDFENDRPFAKSDTIDLMGTTHSKTDVKGYVSANKVASFIAKIAGLPAS